MEEIDIINGVKSGNKSAFDYLVREYKNMVYSLCINMLGDYHNAEDIAQDIFIKIYKNIGGFNFQSELRTWIYRIAYNKCLDEIKKKQRFTKLKALLNSANKVYSYQQDTEIKKVVRQALAQLPEKDRAAITLYYLQQLSYQEISAITSDSPDSLKMRVTRAKKKLKEKLNDVYKDEVKDLLYER